MKMNFKKKMVLFVVLTLIIGVLAAGCSSSSAIKDKFVGRWTGPVPMVKNTMFHMDIASTDGQTFTITFINQNGNVLTRQTAILKEDKYLEVNPFERLVIAGDGTINYKNTTFKKNKP